MSVEDLSFAVSSVVFNAVAEFVGFIPSLVGGLIVLLIGLVLGAIVYRVILGALKALQFEKFLAKYGIVKIDGYDVDWPEILAEIARWSIIVVFLIPTFSAWRLDAVNTVLNRVVLFIPNVIVAVVLAIIGLVFFFFFYKIAYSAGRSLGRDLAIIVGFLVLQQLGVAQELLRILFAGLVAMIAIAGGLAFGLGGQTVARGLLETVLERFKK